MKNNTFHIIIACLLSIPLSACFTGVESTPKITVNDVKRQDAATISSEAKLVETVVGDSIDSWQPGKEFIVVDSKGAIIFSPHTTASAEVTRGTILRFDGMQHGTSITGNKDVTLFFITPQGSRLSYTTTSLDHTIDIPFTVDVSVVDKARQLLKGKNLWVMTSIWRDSLDNVEAGLKFVPIRITDVAPGTGDYPIRIDFSTIDISPDRNGSLFISTANRGTGSRRFESQFSLTDPRKRYPEIEDNAWQLITRNMVAPGMSREECRLSLGSPRDINRRAGYSSVRETWYYENGIYLIFSDGVLIDYRR